MSLIYFLTALPPTLIHSLESPYLAVVLAACVVLASIRSYLRRETVLQYIALTDSCLVLYILIYLVPRRSPHFVANTLHALIPVISGTALYWLISRSYISKRSWLFVASAMSAISTLIGAVGLWLVYEALQRLEGFSSASIASLRSLVPVVGDSTIKNDNLMLLLLLLAFPLAGMGHWRVLTKAARVNFLLAAATLCSVVALGASRATTISLLCMVGACLVFYAATNKLRIKAPLF
jgi:hypothetical protein